MQREMHRQPEKSRSKAYEKAQAAAGAAVLLAVIAGVLIMFILAVSPQERAELLGEPSKNATSPASAANELLRVSPGRIDLLGQDKIEHPLPVVHIYTRTESEILAERSRLYAFNKVFSEEDAIFSFSLDAGELQYLDNALLGFRVKESKGDLIITLNGEKIFHGEPASPVTLPVDLLQEQNTLAFSTSSPGIAFWATHRMLLEEVKIAADRTSVAAQEAEQIFLLSETEARNLEKAALRFLPQCLLREVGMLTITLNDKHLYRAIPDCDIGTVKVEIAPSALQPGENALSFHTESGDYLLTSIVVKTELEEVDFPTYFFEVSEELEKETRNNKAQIVLRLDFVEGTERKFGELIINGRQQSFDTTEAQLSLDVSDDIMEGTNSVKIRPRKTIEVRQLAVKVER